MRPPACLVRIRHGNRVVEIHEVERKKSVQRWNQHSERVIGGGVLLAAAICAVSIADPPPLAWLGQSECRISASRCGHSETPECCTGNADCFYCPSGRQSECKHIDNSSSECAPVVTDPPARCNWYQQGQCWPDLSCDDPDPESTVIGKKCRDWINVIHLHCDRSACVQRTVQ